jgi:hypothetical protein
MTPNSQQRHLKKNLNPNAIVINESIKGRFHIVEKALPADEN